MLTGQNQKEKFDMISAGEARKLGSQPTEDVEVFLAALSIKISETAPKKRSMLLSWGKLGEVEQTQAKSILENDFGYKVKFNKVPYSSDPRERDYWTIEW